MTVVCENSSDANSGEVPQFEDENTKEIDETETLVAELAEKLANKKLLRQENIDAPQNWPDECFFSGLDSSLKRNNAFVKKLKTTFPVDQDGRVALLTELDQLNLVKFIDEVASALATTDRKFKTTDFAFAVQLCSLVHQRYQTFQQSFLSLLKKQFEIRKDEKTTSTAAGGAKTSTRLLRVDVRFLAELILAGVLPDKEGIPLLYNYLSHLLAPDSSMGQEMLSFVISFVLFSGEDFAGVLPRHTKRLKEKYPQLKFPKSDVFPLETQKMFAKLLLDYFSAVRNNFKSKEKFVMDLIKRNYSILNSKGELHEEKKEQYESEYSALQKLHQSMTSLAELMGINPDEVPSLAQLQSFEQSMEAQLDELDTSGVVVEKFPEFRIRGIGNEAEAEFDYDRSRWPDFDTQQFYEDFPDIIPMLPLAAVRAGTLLRQTEETADGIGEVADSNEEGGEEGEGEKEDALDEEKVNEEELEGDEDDDEIECDKEKGGTTENNKNGNREGGQRDTEKESGKKDEDFLLQSKEGRSSSNKKGVQKGSKGSASDALEMALADIGWNNEADMDDDTSYSDNNNSGVAAGANANSLPQIQFEKFLTRLPECISRQNIDDASIEFATSQGINNQANRVKLARTLFMVNRNRLDLLPFYGRFVATIYPCAPEVATELNNALYREFRGWILKKDQIKIESKIKTVTFIGELTKFGVYKSEQTLRVLKQLLKSFVHHQIDMTCALLETTGRFLYRTPATHRLAKFLLDEMMRKKSVLNLDPRLSAMVDNAFYCTNPPPSSSVLSQMGQQERLPVMLAYIQHLVTRELNKTNVDKVLNQLRKLHWEEEDVVDFTRDTFTRIWEVKFSNIQYVASVLAGLAKYHDDVVIHVIDNILEEIRQGMEVQQAKFNQRRISVIKYLGELYNYKLLDSSVVFHVLFSLITFGSWLFDPPHNLFRIRLVCTLLDTCGQFFNGGLAKKKLDCFLVYFQRYLCEKREWFRQQSLQQQQGRGSKNKLEDQQNKKSQGGRAGTLVEAMSHNSSSKSGGAQFPTDIENMICDTIEQLRPLLKLEFDLSSAQEAVVKLEMELKETYLSSLSLDVDGDSDKQNQWKQTNLDDISPSLNNANELYDISELEESEFYNSSSPPPQSLSRVEEESINDQKGITQEKQLGDIDEVGFRVSSSTNSTGGPEPGAGGAFAVQHSQPMDEAENETDDFIETFEKFLSENIQQRTSEAVRAAAADLSLPLTARKKIAAAQNAGVAGDQNSLSNLEQLSLNYSPKSSAILPISNVTTAPSAESTSTPGAAGSLSIMLKKGSKVQLKDLHVPITEEMAENIRQQNLAEERERKKLIEMTLNINQRQQEEEQMEIISSIQKGIADSNRFEKRDKNSGSNLQGGGSGNNSGYQFPPKGVPNTSHIFGSGGSK